VGPLRIYEGFLRFITLAFDKIDKSGIREKNGKTHKFLLGSQRYKSYDWSTLRTGK